MYNYFYSKHSWRPIIVFLLIISIWIVSFDFYPGNPDVISQAYSQENYLKTLSFRYESAINDPFHEEFGYDIISPSYWQYNSINQALPYRYISGIYYYTVIHVMLGHYSQHIANFLAIILIMMLSFKVFRKSDLSLNESFIGCMLVGINSLFVSYLSSGFDIFLNTSIFLIGVYYLGFNHIKTAFFLLFASAIMRPDFLAFIVPIILFFSFKNKHILFSFVISLFTFATIILMNYYFNGDYIFLRDRELPLMLLPPNSTINNTDNSISFLLNYLGQYTPYFLKIRIQNILSLFIGSELVIPAIFVLALSFLFGQKAYTKKITYVFGILLAIYFVLRAGNDNYGGAVAAANMDLYSSKWRYALPIIIISMVYGYPLFLKHFLKGRIFNLLYHISIIIFSLLIIFSGEYSFSLDSRIRWRESLEQHALFLNELPEESIIITDPFYDRFLYGKKIISIFLFRNVINKKLVLDWLTRNSFSHNSQTPIYVILRKGNNDAIVTTLTSLGFQRDSNFIDADVYIYHLPT